MNIVLLGFVASLCAGFATGLGPLPAVFVRRVSDRVMIRGYEREATFGIVIGFIVMMALDNLFG